MAVFNINFTVDGESQTITRTSPRKIRAGSRNYFYAVFQFLDTTFTELEGLTAVFSGVPSERNRGSAWAVPIEADNGVYAVQIPWEVMTRRGTVYVGIYAGDLLVTNEAEFEVTKAAPTNGGNPLPSASWLTRLLEMIAGKQDALTAGENITISENNVISATGGGGGGDSYWKLDDDDLLIPADGVEGVDLNSLVLSGLGGIMMSNGGVVMVKKLVFADPTTSTAGTKGEIIWSRYSDKFFVCTDISGGVYTWDELIYRSAMMTQLNRYQLKLTAGEGIKMTGDDSDIISVDADSSVTQDGTKPVTGAAVDSYVTGKGYYIKPSGGIPASDLASGVIPTVPTKVSDLTNDSGFVNAAGAASAAPVQSVNGQTGAVTLSIPDVSGKQDKSNLVTSLSSSSTDTQYPSAKCVYDLVGNVESLLSAI